MTFFQIYTEGRVWQTWATHIFKAKTNHSRDPLHVTLCCWSEQMLSFRVSNQHTLLFIHSCCSKLELIYFFGKQKICWRMLTKPFQYWLQSCFLFIQYKSMGTETVWSSTKQLFIQFWNRKWQNFHYLGEQTHYNTTHTNQSDRLSKRHGSTSMKICIYTDWETSKDVSVIKKNKNKTKTNAFLNNQMLNASLLN